MSKPIIAVDIDEVLGAYAVEFVKFSNERWGTHLTVDDYKEHWSEMWEVDMEETTRRAKELYKSGMTGRIPHIIGANEALKQLMKDFDIVLVTSRPIVLEQETRAWLEKYYSDVVTAIYFAGMYDGAVTSNSFMQTKATIYSELKPAFVVDDQLKHCYAAVELGIDTILFGDYPWNQDMNATEGLVRCHDWQAVIDHIQSQPAI